MTKHELKCEKCGNLLAEVEGNQLKSQGFGIRIDPGAYAEGLAWAICDKCAHQTAFDASWLKKPTTN